MSVVIGVDPGLNTTGVAVAERKKSTCEVLYMSDINTNAKNSLPERLDKIFSSLEKIISEFELSVLILEKLYSHYRHPVTSSLLGHARGVIMLLAAQKNLEVIEYPATRVKKAVTSYGTASKTQIKKMVSHICGMKEEISSQHIADAIALILTYLHTKKL